MTQSATLGAGLDWKTSLQELAAAGLASASPSTASTRQGPDHEKDFTARAVVGDEVLGEGVGRSKKEAEQKAAEQAWTALDQRRRAAALEPTAVTTPREPEAADAADA